MKDKNGYGAIDMKIDASIKLLIEWADTKIRKQQEPPWARPHYEQLLATLTAIKASREATILLEDSLQSDMFQETDRPLPEKVFPLDIARYRRGIAKIQLPM
jgi:hypothetical protein